MPEKESENKKERKWVSLSGLKARGWTEALARKFLGPEDKTVPNPRYASAPPMRLWALERVEAVEATEAFKEALKRAEKRIQAGRKGAQKRRELTLDLAKTLPLEVPRTSLEELAEAAALHYKELTGKRERFKPWPEPDPFRDRLCVNFLRHEATEYEEYLDEFWGKPGTREAYLVLWERFARAVAEAYPELAKEAKRQLRERRERVEAQKRRQKRRRSYF